MAEDRSRYDLSPPPDFDLSDPAAEARYAKLRASYPETVADLRPPLAQGLAYRGLGYSYSGIATNCGVTEAIVAAWMATIIDRFGNDVVESPPQSAPVEVLE